MFSNLFFFFVTLESNESESVHQDRLGQHWFACPSPVWSLSERSSICQPSIATMSSLDYSVHASENQKNLRRTLHHLGVFRSNGKLFGRKRWTKKVLNFLRFSLQCLKIVQKSLILHKFTKLVKFTYLAKFAKFTKIVKLINFTKITKFTKNRQIHLFGEIR